MEIFGLCLLIAQILLLIGIFVLLGQIRGFIRREDLPGDDSQPAKQCRFVVIRMRLICIFLVAGAIIAILRAILKILSVL
jgi:hypothetical protein